MTVDRYRELCARHRWNVPHDFNIAAAVCGRHASDGARVAIYWEDESGATTTLSFGELQRQANRCANALAALGVGRGDKLAIMLPQRPETAIAHIACYQLGAVAVPLSFLFGPEALEYRLQNSESLVAIVDPASLPNLAPIRDRLPGLRHAIGVAGAREAVGARLGPVAAERPRTSSRRWRRAPPIRRSSSTPAGRPARRRAR